MSLIWTNWFAVVLFVSMVGIFFYYFLFISREKKQAVSKHKNSLPESKAYNFDARKELQVVMNPCVPAPTFESLVTLLHQVDGLVVKWYYKSNFLLIEHFDKKKKIGVFTISNFIFHAKEHESFTQDGTFTSLSMQINHVDEFSQTRTAAKMFHLADSLRSMYGPECMLYERTGRGITSKSKIATLVDKTTSW